jgi:hypothetical protein
MGEFARATDEIITPLGELGQMASAIKASGMNVADHIEGRKNVLQGVQKQFLDDSASKLERRAYYLLNPDKDPLRGARSRLRREFDPTFGTGRSTGGRNMSPDTQYGSVNRSPMQSEFSMGLGRVGRAETRARMHSLDVDATVDELARQYAKGGTGPVDLSELPSAFQQRFEGMTHEDLAGIMEGAGVTREKAHGVLPHGFDKTPEELLDAADEARERAKTYELSDEDRASAQARLNFLVANHDELQRLADSPEMAAWEKPARAASRETESAFQGNDPRVFDAARESLDDAVAEARKIVEARRTWEHDLLFPDRDVPDSVREAAFYRPHKSIDDRAKNIGGVRKNNATAMSSRRNTGVRFIKGLDDPDPRHLIDAYIEQRETGQHNYIRANLANLAEPMTRGEYAKRVANGEKLVNISSDPKLIKHYMESAKLIRKFADALPEGTRGVNSMRELAEEQGEVASWMEKGARFKDKKIVAVPEAVFAGLRNDAYHTQTALGQLFSKGTDYWRPAVLSYRAPQWMFNNAVGQATLLAVGAGPAKGGKALLQIAKDSKLSKAVDDVAGELSSTAPGRQLVQSSIKHDAPTSKVGRAAQKYLEIGEKVGAFNSKWADDPFRKARFVAHARKDIDALKAAGHAVDDADAVRQLAKDPEWLDDAIEATLGDMIDFGNLKPFERRYLRNVFPFYSWMKGSAGVSARILQDKPGKASLANALGDTALEDQQGMPSFLQGAIAVPGFLQNDEGSRVLSTAGANPFMSPVDSISAAGQYLPFMGLPESYGGESLIAQMNPFIKAPISAATGRDPFFGGALAGKPILPGVPYTMTSRGDFALGQLLNIPQTKLLNDLFSEPSPESLYDKPAWQPLLQFFGGLPVKDVRLGQARRRAMEEAANTGPVNKG